jgi:hypothetical protein
MIKNRTYHVDVDYSKNMPFAWSMAKMAILKIKYVQVGLTMMTLARM